MARYGTISFEEARSGVSSVRCDTSSSSWRWSFLRASVLTGSSEGQQQQCTWQPVRRKTRFKSVFGLGSGEQLQLQPQPQPVAAAAAVTPGLRPQPQRVCRIRGARLTYSDFMAVNNFWSCPRKLRLTARYSRNNIPLIFLSQFSCELLKPATFKVFFFILYCR